MQEEAQKITRAIQLLMENLGRPEWCSSCEDWCARDHFLSHHTTTKSGGDNNK